MMRRCHSDVLAMEEFSQNLRHLKRDEQSPCDLVFGFVKVCTAGVLMMVGSMDGVLVTFELMRGKELMVELLRGDVVILELISGVVVVGSWTQGVVLE